jgi:Acyl carrier protein
MTRENVFEGLKEILSGVKPKLDQSKISYESKLVNDLGIDSLSMLLLSLAAENKFNMQFDPQAPVFVTVGDVCDYILKAISN